MNGPSGPLYFLAVLILVLGAIALLGWIGWQALQMSGAL
jgi:hypothetical protein